MVFFFLKNNQKNIQNNTRTVADTTLVSSNFWGANGSKD
jgi:hypothetical protein